MTQISRSMGPKTTTENIAGWVRGLVWTAMILGCAWAGAQSYLVVPPGHYAGTSMGAGVAMGGGAAAGAQNAEALSKDDLFAGTEVFAKNATNITEITMDPDTLNLVGGPDEHKAHNMVLNVVRTYEYDKPGMYNMADVDAIRNKLNTGDWHCSVHVRDLKNGSGSDVCNKRRTDGLKETAIIEVSPKSLTFVHTIRRSSPGSSELGFFPMLPGLGPMTMMAMTNPEALADMQVGLADMRAGMSGFPFMFRVQPDVMMKWKALRVQPFNEKQMKDLNEQFKNFKPLSEQQMRELNDRMKDLKVMPPMPATPPDGSLVAPPAPASPPPPSGTAPAAPEPK